MFLSTIAADGRLAIPHPDRDPPALEQLLESDLLAHEAMRRMELIQPAPPFDVAAGMFATRIMYRCFQFLIYRDLGAEAVKRVVHEAFPGEKTPSVCYSADIAFAYLPDLHKLARGISPGDPLIQGICDMARAWPLSSVGIADVGEVDVSGFMDDAALRDLYMGRIVERGDRVRAKHPQVQSALRCAVGMYVELAGGTLPALSKETGT